MFRAIWNFLRRRRRDDRDVEAELRSYADLLTDERTSSGVPRDQARRSALADIGGLEPIKEDMRDAHPGAFFDRLRQDVRFGLRMAARTPGVSLAIVLTLGLGIGATTATFSVVDGVLLRPLPYQDADALVAVMHDRDQPVSPGNFTDWQRDTTGFSTMGAAEYWTPSLTGAGAPEKLYALHVTPEILPMLGVAPAMGRVLAHGADALREVVIGHGLWQRAFAGDPAILDREITLDGAAYRVVGVMPQGFRFAPFWATRAELWAPFDAGVRAGQRRSNSLRVFARLAPGATLEQARGSVAAVTARLESEFLGTNRNVTVTPVKDLVVGDVRPSIAVLFGAVLLVLLVACANVAHMLLARASAREKEVAVRAALGAGRRRMIRQFLTESLVFALGGGALGAALAYAGAAVVRALGSSSLPRVEAVGIDGRALAFTLLVALATALIFGIVPALRASRPDLTSTLRDSERGSTAGRGSRRIRSVLIASEIAVAVVLLVAAGLFARSFAAVRHVDPGFNPDRLLAFVVSVTGTAEAAPDRRLAFYQSVVDGVRALPGVERVGAINHVPLVGDIWGLTFAIEGRPTAEPGDEPAATFRVTLPGYFETTGRKLAAGRDFSEADRIGAEPVVIVSEFLARTAWPGDTAIGKRLQMPPGPKGEWRTVIGVAAHGVRSSWRDRPDREVFLPLLQSAAYRADLRPHVAYFSFVARTSGDPSRLVPEVKRTIQGLSPFVPVSEIVAMPDVVAQATLGDRFMVAVVGAFAVMALVLTSIGIYGVVSFDVSRRRHEIGIRLALGAGAGRVLRGIVLQGLTVTGLGTLAGIGGALLGARAIAGLLFGVTPFDLPTFAAVAGVLAVVAAAACYLPARQASRINPVKELR
jgi:putative ABC transport system permease protein